jgi:hypothetical protein
MTARNETVLSCPRPTPFHDEAEQVLFEIARLEAALETEVDRLRTLSAPSKPGMARLWHRDVWWWRVKLVEWAYALRTEQEHPTEVLAGLRLVLREFSDRDLAVFLDRSLGNRNEPTAA